MVHLNISLPGNIKEQYGFQDIYLVRLEDRECIEPVNLEPDDDEIRMGYDTDTTDYTDEELEQICAAQQSMERVNMNTNEPIYLDVFGTMNTNEECEIETSKFGRFRGMFDSGASINCMDRQYAYKYYKKHIKKTN